jgi:hypothetical protein
MAIGWRFNLGHVFKSFEHILHDLGPVGVLLATSMGMPEAAGVGVFELLMKAHAGDHAAKQHVERVLARGGKWPAFLDAAAKRLKLHPSWKRFTEYARKHARKQKEGAREVTRAAPGRWATSGNVIAPQFNGGQEPRDAVGSFD